MATSILAKAGVCFPTNASRLARFGMATARRGLLTHVQQPGLAAVSTSKEAIPERPCTLVLAQDAGFYDSSWNDHFSQYVVSRYGMSYAQFSLPTLDTETTVDAALQELARDLSAHPQTILIARGPWMSWMAQLYLESLSLAGLVLVDPLALDDQNSIDQFDLVYQKKGLEKQTSYRLFQECVNHWDHWTLRLEPGSVPMMVLNSIARPGFVKAAENTARRHAGDSLDHKKSPWDSGNVALDKLLPKEGVTQADEAMQKIVAWVDQRVL